MKAHAALVEEMPVHIAWLSMTIFSNCCCTAVILAAAVFSYVFILFIALTSSVATSAFVKSIPCVVETLFAGWFMIFVLTLTEMLSLTFPFAISIALLIFATISFLIIGSSWINALLLLPFIVFTV
jgi:hypothetical protein